MVLSERIGRPRGDVAVVTSCERAWRARPREEPFADGRRHRVHDMRRCPWRFPAPHAIGAAPRLKHCRLPACRGDNSSFQPAMPRLLRWCRQVLQPPCSRAALPATACALSTKTRAFRPCPIIASEFSKHPGKRSPEALALAEEVRNTIRLGPSLRDASIMRQNWAQSPEPSPNPRARDREQGS